MDKLHCQLRKEADRQFKVLKSGGKNSEKEFDSICPVGTTTTILYGKPKVHKTVVHNTPILLFYQQ